MRVRVKTKGFSEAIKRMEQRGKVDVVENIIKRSLGELFNVLTVLTPVQDGFLRQSMGMEYSWHEGIVFWGADYAAHVNYGHRLAGGLKVKMPDGSWITTKEGYVEGQFFALKGKNQFRDRFNAISREEVRKVLYC